MRARADESSFRGRGVCVRVWWGERLLDQRFVAHRKGTAPRSAERTPRFGPVLHPGEDGLQLRVPRGMRATLFEAGAWREINVEEGAIPLEGVTHAKVDGGPLTYEFTEQAAPRQVPPEALDASSYLPLNIGVAFLTVFGALILTAQQRMDELPMDPLARTSMTMDKRHVSLVRPRPSEPAGAVSNAKANAPTAAAPEPEPAASSRSYTQRNERPGRPRQPRVRASDETRTASAVVSDLFARAHVRQIFASSTAGEDRLIAAVGGIKGPASVTHGDGSGGLGLLRGGSGVGQAGPGGRLATVGIGGLHTRGRGSGEDAYGANLPLRAGKKPAASVEEQEPPTCELDGESSCGLDRELIRSVIASKRAQIRFCYERVLQRQPGLAGKVTLRFSIAPHGGVPFASIAASGLGSAEVERCLVGRARTWLFPRPADGGSVQVTYPFVFKPSGG